MAKVEIQLFAAARELAGESICLDVQHPLTVEQLLQHLAKAYPQLAIWVPICRVAMDETYVGPQTIVDPYSQLALIPPVSGG